MVKKVLEVPEILEDTTFYWEYRKEFDVWFARVKKEQLKTMAANPSVEMVAYELGYMKDDMTLEQLEQVFSDSSTWKCSRASGEKRSGKVSSCGNGLNRRLAPGVYTNPA